MEVRRLANQSLDNSESALIVKTNNYQKGKKKEQLKCSLGHLGHGDDRCRVRLQTELDECKKQLDQQKKKPKQAQSAVNISEGSVHPSYYDHAFTASSALSNSVFDTGASNHMISEFSIIDNPQPIPPSCIVVAAKVSDIWATQTGLVSLGRLHLSQVLYSKELTGNLISIGRLCDAGYRVVFSQTSELVIDKNDEVIIRMTRDPLSDRL